MGAPFLVAEGAPNILRGRRYGRKGAFSCQKGASFGERGGLSGGGVAGEKAHFVPKERLCRQEGAHITLFVQK